MLMDEEGLQDTENNLIHIGKPIELDEGKFLEQLEELKEYVVTEPSDIREWVKKLCRRISEGGVERGKYETGNSAFFQN